MRMVVSDAIDLFCGDKELQVRGDGMVVGGWMVQEDLTVCSCCES